MRRIWLWVSICLLAAIPVGAQQIIKKAAKAVAVVYVFPNMVPEFVLHESMHKAALATFGVSSRIVIRNLMPWNFDPLRMQVYTVADSAITVRKIGNSRFKTVAVLL